ncbi:hypothetical protein TNCV_792721 [Trichonephila clavipes]|nr:hypothetical protein TNCV_792721 [Trichonephila clavipes]
MIVGSSGEGMVLPPVDRVPGGQELVLLKGKTEIYSVYALAVGHRTKSVVEIRAAVVTTVTHRTVRHLLLQEHLRARRPIACIALTPSHSR